MFEYARRCFVKDHNALTGESVVSVVDKTDVMFVWMRRKSLKMFEVTPTEFVFIVHRDSGYDRYQINVVAMPE